MALFRNVDGGEAFRRRGHDRVVVFLQLLRRIQCLSYAVLSSGAAGQHRLDGIDLGVDVMPEKSLLRGGAMVLLALALGEGGTVAQEPLPATQAASADAAGPFSFSLATAHDGGLGLRDSSLLFLQAGESDRPDDGAKSHDYREISDFFNVREANVNTTPGEWELELEAEWMTGAGGDDDFTFTPNIKYGLNDDMFIEFEVRPLVIGDGGDQGNGDTSLQLFYQLARETDTFPALATWAEARFPTGQGSSGVDGELHFNVTKTLMTDVRGHLEGFVMTANGGRGDEDENRRAFQWGAGVGLDYQIDDLTICTMNYLNRSSEEYGHSNQQVLELGGVRQIAENQHLKLAMDVGLDDDESPNFGVKCEWSIEW
jgi:hypothetical protein